jgi:hypothetical protein
MHDKSIMSGSKTTKLAENIWTYTGKLDKMHNSQNWEENDQNSQRKCQGLNK